MSNFSQFINSGIPIGTLVSFPDSEANSVSFQGQTFLKTGVTALASSYPAAPFTTLLPGPGTLRTHPEAFSSVAWSPSLSLFVAAPVSASGSIYSSTDGITWTARQTVTVAQVFIYWTGTMFVSFPSGSGTQAYSSTNGTSWTPFTLPSITSGGSLQSVAQVGTNIVILPGGSANTTWYSTNSGTSWTTGTVPSTGGYILASSTTFLFVNNTGSSGNVSANNGSSFATSSWNTAGTLTNFRTDGTYIYSENIGGTIIPIFPTGVIRSQDGVNWTNIGTRNSIAFPTIPATSGTGVHYVGGIFIWSMSAGQMRISTDGINGKNGPSSPLPISLLGTGGSPGNIGSFAYGNNILVCACSGGTQAVTFGTIANYIDNTINSSVVSGTNNYMRVM